MRYNIRMDTLREVLRRKQNLSLIYAGVYLAGIILAKWRLYPPAEAVWVALGGLIGVYLLDVADVVTGLTPSPFSSVVFLAVFAVVGFFVSTSSVSLMAQGLVLSAYLELILRQARDWMRTGNLAGWYHLVEGTPDSRVQRMIYYAFISVFIIETYLFVR